MYVSSMYVCVWPRLRTQASGWHLCQYRCTPDTPIYRYFSRHRPNTPQAVSAQGLGLLIREGAALLSPDIDVSACTARCFRPSAASALLLIGVDSNLIRLLGRWQSDAMLRYLHVQAAPIRTAWQAKWPWRPHPGSIRCTLEWHHRENHRLWIVANPF